jgi:hypothetical protein
MTWIERAMRPSPDELQKAASSYVAGLKASGMTLRDITALLFFGLGAVVQDCGDDTELAQEILRAVGEK